MSLSVVVLLVFDVRKKDFLFRGGQMDTEQELDDFECEEINYIQENYNNFYKWIFGHFNAYQNKDEGIEKLKSLHPDKNINAYLNSICLVMDACPLYLKYRSKT